MNNSYVSTQIRRLKSNNSKSIALAQNEQRIYELVYDAQEHLEIKNDEELQDTHRAISKIKQFMKSHSQLSNSRIQHLEVESNRMSQCNSDVMSIAKLSQLKRLLRKNHHETNDTQNSQSKIVITTTIELSCSTKLVRNRALYEILRFTTSSLTNFTNSRFDASRNKNSLNKSKSTILNLEVKQVTLNNFNSINLIFSIKLHYSQNVWSASTKTSSWRLHLACDHFDDHEINTKLKSSSLWLFLNWRYCDFVINISRIY